jgi:hypothetical protein
MPDKLMTMDDLATVEQKPNDPAAQTATGVYVGTKMQDLPSAYRDQMPIHDDPQILLGAEQAIRAQFRHDLKTTKLAQGIHATLGTVRSVEDATRAIAQARADSDQASPQAETDLLGPQAAIDPQLVTAADKILAGLKASTPARPLPDNGRALVSTQTRKPQLGGIDTSKMSASQKMMIGLSQSTPSQPGRGTGPRKPAA